MLVEEESKQYVYFGAKVTEGCVYFFPITYVSYGLFENPLHVSAQF